MSGLRSWTLPCSPELIRGGSESLAGRIEFIELHGFDLWELGQDRMRDLWVRGGFPRSQLADTAKDSFRWRRAFIQAFVERDLRFLGVDLPPLELSRFLRMLAHLHGQTLNASEVARSLQITHPTVRKYVDILAGAMWLRVLPPWFSNRGKRLVKAPKLYFRDSGIWLTLKGLETWEQLEGHPKLGAPWEGFAWEQVLGGWEGEDPSFWATHGGAELDLRLSAGGKTLGIEFKYSSAPSITRSMHIAMEDLSLDALYESSSQEVVWIGAEGRFTQWNHVLRKFRDH